MFVKGDSPLPLKGRKQVFGDCFEFASLGQEALKTAVYEIKDFLIPDANIVPIPRFSDSLSPQSILILKDEIRMAGHPALSSIILGVLKLTEGAHDAGYEAVISLVETRLKKASSV